MAKNLLVINVDLRETRVALIEDGIIAELHLERASTRSTLGNIVLGKVTRVLPGLQAAFIDIGQERAAFLHVEDLIRPDDFDAYLQGGRKHARTEETAGEEEADEDAAPAEVQNGAPTTLERADNEDERLALLDEERDSQEVPPESGPRASEPPIEPPSAIDMLSDASSTTDLSAVDLAVVSSEDLADTDSDSDDEA